MQCIAKTVLIILNLAFIVAGALLIYFGVALHSGHWADVFTSQGVSGANSTAAVAIAFGVIVILIALCGFAGAICKNRCLLVTYSIFVVIAMLIFIALAIIGFVAANVAKNWAAKSYPADPSETDVATGFNQAYCYAEGARFCTTASAQEALAAFFPTSSSVIITAVSTVGVNVSKPTGLVGFCQEVDSKAGALKSSLPSQFTTACSTCNDVASKYGDYKSIYEWANDKCPLTASSATWCGSFLLSNVQNDAYVGAPYQACRPAVLDLWKSYGNKVGIAGVILTVVSIVLIFFACHIRKNPEAYYQSV
ncbi:unnamed protein product [Aphanomyces euteiches]|uniref:Tetraspanin n=1 Tax=Aphanomyces euteiches TaxID=100861 RepID=A0A6G0XVH2_9STRA|nr:hypothetical protein Ae201684_001138 [Aphanomyces euteiches]KAH9099854.1 hypothetical protein Ae201684P_018863 [Aphanomyces euteiches]